MTSGASCLSRAVAVVLVGVVMAGLPGGVAAAPDQAASDPARAVRFNFKNAPFDQVLDTVARQTGLPVISETEVPAGALTFISGVDYSIPEALEVLNLNFAMHGVRLVHEGSFLYLRTVADAARKPTPVTSLDSIDGADPTQYLTVYIPLDNALASNVAEQIKPLVAAPGLVTALDSQNMIILVETAAQCRRIREIVEAIDENRPVDSEYRIFKIHYARPEAVVEALTGLVGQRVVREIIEKDGKVRQVEQFDVAGLNLQPDNRTSSVIAIGSASRLQTVEELIGLLDQPESGPGAGAAETRTFALRSITAEQASAHLDALFRGVDEARRPNVIALDEVGKIVVVATPDLLVQATALLGEVDPIGSGDPVSAERVSKRIALEHVAPGEVEQLAARLLSPRQRQMLKYVAAPGGGAMLVTGSASDVASLERLIGSIDVRPEIDRQVRQIAITGGDPDAVLAEARRLDELGDDAARDPVEAIPDPESRRVTLVGSRAGLARFEGLIRSVERTASRAVETRTYTLGVNRPSQLAGPLARLARPLLEPTDGSAYVAPEIEALDELDMLIVRAPAEQLAVIDGLVGELDAERAGDRQLQILDLTGDDPEGTLARAQDLFDRQADERTGAVEWEIDPGAGKLLVSGRVGAVRLFTDALRQAQQLTPPDRSTRFIDVVHREASEIVTPLRELLASADPIDGSRAVPDAEISVVEETNALLIRAEEAQHRMIADYVRRLDRIEPGDLPPLRLLQLRTADAAAIAGMLQRQYAQRPPAERTSRPVDVRADAATNTLIVSAHAELFDEIRQFVEELNEEELEGPERVTVLYTLKTARAEDVARAMDTLYPMPPTPLDRRGRPMPWLQEPKEVTVSADPSSNSLIIDAPADRIESLEELAARLDRVEVPPVAELRTYQIERADLNAIASTLRGLAARGTLSAPAKSGRPQVQVVIEVEPRSDTLIIAGDEVTFEKVEQVLASLSAVAVERGLRIVPIANAPAADVRERALTIYASQVEQIPGAGAVDVTIDEASNSLEVVADAEAMDRFMLIIDQLQRQIGPARAVRLIELRLARVSDIVSTLRELVRASTALRATGGPEPVFEPIETSNALMVAAQPDQLPIIEQLIRNLDNEQQAERPPLRILRLRSTDAQNIASVLQRQYTRRPVEERALKPVEIDADAATNTLIVSAHPEVLPEIVAIVAELNDAEIMDAEGREIRIFPLTVARAEELARTIDEMYPQPPMPRDARGRARPDLQRPREIVVRADRATNALIVDAPAKRLAGFEQIVEALDRVNVASDVELRTYTVARADLDAVAQTLRQLAQSGALASTSQAPITVSAEPASRTLVVSGPREIFDRVNAVIGEVDGARRPATALRLYTLEHARAERLRPLLEQLLRTRLRESDELAGAGDLLDIAVDGASNTLIISAPEQIQEISEQLIRSLDTEASAAGRSVIRVVPLANADPGQVAETIARVMDTLDPPPAGPVSVLPAAGSSALLLTGYESDLRRVEELIEPLDRPPFDPDQSSVETFALEHADAPSIASMVERLLTDQRTSDPRYLTTFLRYSRGRLPEGPAISVQADERTNSLVVSAPSATLALARSIIAKLDEPDDRPETSVLTFTPARGEAGRLIEAVRPAVAAKFPAGRRRVELTAEPSTGSVVVTGPAEQAAEVVRLLGDFDDRTPAMPLVELRTFELEHADAAAVARSVQGVLNDRSRWPADLRRAERASLPVPAPGLVPDETTNRVLVSAAAALMPLADELISALDRPGAGATVDVRVFPLSEGDATSVAQAIARALAVGIEPGEPEPSVHAEPASNAIVIAAAPDRLEQAARLIGEMDDSVEPEGIGVRTVFLTHARAEALAPIVQQILAQESMLDIVPEWQRWQVIRDMARQGRSTQGPEVRVAAEPRLNALVISAPKRVLELAEQIVSGLDVDRDEGLASDRSISVITLINADAEELAANLQGVFAEEESAVEPPTVRVDTASNSLIVRADPVQLSLINELARSLDKATVTSRSELRMIPLDRSRTDALEMARTLKRLLEQQGGVTVEVISADELLGEPAGEDEGADGASSFSVPAHPGAPPGPGGAPIAALAIPASALPPSPDAAEPAVTIAVDRDTNTLIVVGAPRLAERIALLAEELERQMPAGVVGVRIVELPDAADPRSVAGMINNTVRQVGRAGPENPGGFTGRVAVTPDVQGQAVIVWANATDFEPIRELIAGVARTGSVDEVFVKVYPLANVSGQRALRSIRDLLSTAPVGRQARRVRALSLTLTDAAGQTVRGRLDPSTVSATVDPTGTSLIVTAPPQTIDLIDRFVGLIDQSPVRDRAAIRRYPLANADAGELARTFQALFDAQRQGPGAREMPRARFVSDDRTNAMLVTASSAQHADVARMIETADVSLEEDTLVVEVLPMQVARPSAVRQIVEEIIVGRDPGRRDQFQISAADQAGVLVVRASADEIEEIRALVAQVDTAEAAAYPVRAIRLERADAASVARQLQQFFQQRGRVSRERGGNTRGGDAAIVGDRQSGTLVVSASDEDFQQISELAALFDAPSDEKQLQFRIVRLAHARVGDIEESIQSIAFELQWERYIWGRSSRQDQDAEPPLLVETNARTNTVLLFGTGEQLDMIEQVIAQIDTPAAADQRVTVRVVPATGADLNAIAQIVQEVTASPGWRFWMGPDKDAVTARPDPARGVLLLVGKKERVDEAVEIVRQIATGGEDQRIETIALETARAIEVSRALDAALPDTVRVRITPVQRNNSLLVTGTEEAIGIVRAEVAKLDREPDRAPVEFRRFALEFADSGDVSFTLSQMVRNRPRPEGDPAPNIDFLPDENALAVTATAEDLEFIAQVIGELDVEYRRERRTEFVKLDFATAEQAADALRVFYGRLAPEAVSPADRNVSIVADPASNSLVISADESAFEGIRALLEKLDTEEYDTSQQLVVIPLKHASAQSVARALNDGFRAPLENQLQRERVRIEAERSGRNQNRQNETYQPTVLVDAEGTPTVAAEPQSNSLIVFAGRKELERIRALVEQLDVPDFLQLPDARIVALEQGKASEVAEAVRRVFVESSQLAGTPRQVLIFGDDASNSVIVRAEDDQFEQIQALALALQGRVADAAPAVRVVRLRSMPAARMVATISQTFGPLARQRGEVFGVSAERASNSLVVTASGELHRQIAEMIADLEGAAPDGADAGRPGIAQDITIVDVSNNDPRDIMRLLVELGVTRPQPQDRPGIVSEPVIVTPMTSRRALAVIANPPDARVITALIDRLDAEPIAEVQSLRIVPLELATAGQLVRVLEEMIAPGEQDAGTGAARALAEQVRRLNLTDGAGRRYELDLSVPIRLIADESTNAVLIASTTANAEALAEIARALDTLPMGEAVTVRIFPLENAAAARIRSIIDELFRQGEQLRRLPGTQRRGLPENAVGQALAGEIAVAVDERTNALVVAGREEAVALVEVLVRDLDSSDHDRGWIEAQLVPLEHADPVTLAEKLARVLIEGLGETPEEIGLQRQIGRLRIVAGGGELDDPAAADLFAPLSGLVIEPEEDLGALIVVGTPTNIDAVRRLVEMLDVEQAAAGNQVRVIPLRFAEAGRVAGVISQVFRERSQLRSDRPEDRVIVSVDTRTNALIVSTSGRSFAILETLISTLDQEESRFAVGLHVLPVPNADVTQLAPKIEGLMRERIQAARSRGGVESPMDVFRIEAEPGTGSLIVAASDENLLLVEELIEALTAGGTEMVLAERTELIQLETPGRSDEIAEAVTELYVERENRRRGPGSVSVVSSERQNALLVSGTDADIDAIRELARRLDTADVEIVQEVRRVGLDSASANEVVELLEDILSGRSIAGGRGGIGATKIRVYSDRLADSMAEATIDGAVRDQISVTADPRTNSILITAPPAIMELIVTLIEDLDDETRGDRVIEKFQLENSDAESMQRILVELFNLQRRGNRYVLAPVGLRRRGPDGTPDLPDDEPAEGGLFGSGESFTTVPDERQELAVTVDRRTNTLLVSGTRRLIEEVRQVVQELDEIKAEQRASIVYKLRNARAEELEQTLTSYFSGETDLRRTTLGPELGGSLLRELEQEVTIVGDVTSNSLVVSASPRYMDTVKQIIAELDASPPQVMIEVLLAEVTIDQTDEWDVDINIGGTVATSQIGGDGYTFESLAAGAPVATALGVPNLSIASADFGLLIRSLQAQGKLEVLSRPQVQVNNNEEASIQVGEDVIIPTGVIQSGDIIRSETEQQNVGIILNVTPSISDDGFVRMDIAPEISAVSDRTTQIDANFEAPIITQRRVQTTVTVRDGQAVVIGGLIQTQSSERNTKIPLLGDIPVLGWLFRSRDREDIKTELLVILTPYVIPGEGYAAMRRQAELTDRAFNQLEDPTTIRRALEEGLRREDGEGLEEDESTDEDDQTLERR